METSCGGSEESIIQLEAPPQFRAYLDDVIVRMGYLYPEARFHIEGNAVCVEAKGSQLSLIKRDFNFGLYRQKVYAENRDLRRKLIEGVMGK